MSRLFEPLKMRGITLRNRVVVSPMCQYSSEDGFASDWHLVHLGARAVGGAGVVFTEATAVPARAYQPAGFRIWKDGHIPMLKRITDFVKARAPRRPCSWRMRDALIDRAALGRRRAHRSGCRRMDTHRGSCQRDPLAPGYQTPETLTVDDIAKIAQASRRRRSARWPRGLS